MIAGEHADANGTYVALTRAREHTHLYTSAERLDAGDPGDVDREDRLARLAERLGRSEPEVPSIAVALAHEQAVARELDRKSTPSPCCPDRRYDNGDGRRRQVPDQREQRARTERDRAARVMATRPSDPDVAHAIADAQHAAGQAPYAAAQGG